MKQSLQLKLGQQLTMTPQLQLAIRLLQLSTLDLQQEIQLALDTNPLLEVDDDDYAPDPEVDNITRLDTVADNHNDGLMESQEGQGMTERDSGDDWQPGTIPEDLPVDTQWDDLMPSSTAGSGAASDDGFDGDFDSRNNATDSLQDQLRWQLNLTRLSDIDRVIALALIDATDSNGRLQASVDDIHQSLIPELDIDPEEVTAVLRCLQQFEPAGVCTRDLQECLLVQLQQKPAGTPSLEHARAMITRHLSQLGSGDYKQIMRRMRLSESQLKAALDLIRTLDPNPGQGVGEDTTEYVVPDVFVSKKNGRWVIELNPDIAPRLRINSGYASLIKRADSSADNTYLKDNLQEARWFLKSLYSRNETLMKVATRIVEHQRDFLEHGPEAMKPLVLHDIADAVEMHESTISRVTTRKYMHTPRGIFELKYFFSSHVGTTSGGECSSTAIRAFIRKLVSAESPRKPLSDSKIASLLEGQGIRVARRTIAKYREILMIPPSNERKRLV
ncbi:RNA polymerase factor sigma-54 [Kineobactrum sediminis]|uniref:RNA polymerase sigma-54 factor n=1 Tax=Kineobactrum sediminis TaxID=1905677 RepID=A0A2N5Y3F1_9GAMM|nr:RNA polymerase factor sigma-54 [Kineobactrum sediminis]PLW82908.1 RNA polymerase factor sigma-54 [Kineobactrum sediminis]